MTRPMQPHGTNAAYMQHRLNKEDACDPCLRAHAKYMRDWKAGTLPEKQVAPCGTGGGVQRHRKAGETLCPTCRAFWRSYMADWRKARKAAVLAANKQTTLTTRSTP